MNKFIDIVKEDINLNPGIIRFRIDGTWDADDFMLFFKAVSFLYKFSLSYYNAVNLIANHVNSPEYEKMYIKDIKNSRLKFDILKFISNIRNSDKTYYELYVEQSNILELSLAISHTLKIKSISYASPGMTDLIGLSGILEQIKDLIFYYFPSKKEKVEIDILMQEKLALQIKNLKTIGLNEIEIKEFILKQEKSLSILAHFLDSKMIDDIEVLKSLK